MKRKFMVLLAITSIFWLVSGCTKKTVVYGPDYGAPSAPRGFFSVTGDQSVRLYWLPNPESDIEGYRIYRNQTGCSGVFYYLATVTDSFFFYYPLANGQTYFYAVAAFDFDGYESELSRECVYDTPRPEGYTVLYDYLSDPSRAGFDFSSYKSVPYTSLNADIYLTFDTLDFVFYVVATSGVDIQDFGYTNSLDDIDYAPTQGWSSTRVVEIIRGHSYLVWTADDHYAKFRVENMDEVGGWIRIRWAYQTDLSNGELKITPTALKSGGK